MRMFRGLSEVRQPRGVAKKCDGCEGEFTIKSQLEPTLLCGHMRPLRFGCQNKLWWWHVVCGDLKVASRSRDDARGAMKAVRMCVKHEEYACETRSGSFCNPNIPNPHTLF